MVFPGSAISPLPDETGRILVPFDRCLLNDVADGVSPPSFVRLPELQAYSNFSGCEKYSFLVPTPLCLCVLM